MDSDLIELTTVGAPCAKPGRVMIAGNAPATPSRVAPFRNSRRPNGRPNAVVVVFLTIGHSSRTEGALAWRPLAPPGRQCAPKGSQRRPASGRPAAVPTKRLHRTMSHIDEANPAMHSYARPKNTVNAQPGRRLRMSRIRVGGSHAKRYGRLLAAGKT
ncbi:hypothetical protein MESS4_750261 [Mesorhizobium sp. STM 4661]|nr:hypothetical protein MESS4_750261 [Mesorhizobium sp. STM 4661]